MTRSDERRGERGSALIITVLLLSLLLMLGTGLLATATVESKIEANDRWSEGAFYAAESAVQSSIDLLMQGPASAAVVASTPLGQDYTYRTGRRADTSAQPPTLIGTVNAPNYSTGSSTGYGMSGFVFQIYQVNGTGLGPRNSQREIEVQVEIGPVAN
jgi:Tfp pilus assembly protein PilX